MTAHRALCTAPGSTPLREDGLCRVLRVQAPQPLRGTAPGPARAPAPAADTGLGHAIAAVLAAEQGGQG